MGRPKKQTVEYFPHFVNGDGRVLHILESRFGNDGYAFWYKMLEILGSSEGHYIDLSDRYEWEYFTNITRLESGRAEEVLDLLADMRAIDGELWESSRVVWCQSFVDDLQGLYAKRTQELPRKPGTEKAEPEPETKKEPEAKKKPEPEAKTKTAARKKTLNAEQQEMFERFYEAYPKKVDRATAERAWLKIEPPPDTEATMRIVEAVEVAKKKDSRFAERKYTPNPASWLNAKGYLNKYDDDDTGKEEWGFRASEGFRR